MDAIKKLAFNYGDKILLVLFLLWGLYEIAISISSMGGTPKVVQEAEKVIEQVNRAAPAPPEPPVITLIEDFDAQKEWTLNSFNTSRQSLNFTRRKVDRSEKQVDYIKKLNDHEHFHIPHPDGQGGKHCIFPGCSDDVDPEDEMIGLPSDFQIAEETVMTVKLAWNEPSEYVKTRLSHFVLERKKEGEEEWSSITDEEGEALKIGSQFKQGIPTFEDMMPELIGGEVPAGFPGGIPGDVPPGEFFPGEFFPEEFGFGEFGFPDQAQPNTRTKQPEQEKRSGSRNVNAGVRKVEMGDSEAGEEFKFTYLDYNLDPNTSYQYRIKTYGLSSNLMQVESATWSEPLTAKTKEDKSMRFVKYIPGLRNKDGELVKKRDGSIVSNDKVYIAVSKLFDPPWSPQRYFIEYEHRGIVPGLEGSDGVGKEVSGYSVLTSEGDPVYFDSKKGKFLYIHPNVTETQVKAELEANPKVWKRYRIKQDFTLPWKVLKVVEEIKEEKEVKETFDPTGKRVEKVEVFKTYHYFVELVNRVTKETDRIELERDNPRIRILKF